MLPIALTGTAPVIDGATAFQPILDSITGVITPEAVIGVLAVVAGASVVFAFMWWGVRKVTGGLMSAFRKGKISL